MPALTVLERRSTCNLCSLHTCARSVGIPGRHLDGSLPPSSLTPLVLCVGQNPGLQEDRRGLPFVGPSLRFLHSYLDGIDLRNRCSVFVTNVARCYHGSLGTDNPPESAYTACRPYLLADISALLPLSSSLLLLALGGPAAKALLTLSTPHSPPGTKPHRDKSRSLTTLFSSQGALRTFPLVSGPTALPVFGTYHPAFLMRDLNSSSAVASHMQLVSLHLMGALPPRTRPRFIPPRPPITE